MGKGGNKIRNPGVLTHFKNKTKRGTESLGDQQISFQKTFKVVL